jgi:transposase
VDECFGILYPGFVSKSFRTCDLDQPFLLPPSLQDWLPENHLARFIAELAVGLDLSKIYGFYGRRDGRGKAAYHPVMMVRLLLYGYCVGVMSSRRIERASYEDVAFRYLAADQHPDHDTMVAFRQQHLPVLAQLFTQVLQLCDKAGLVKLGHVAIDGSKLQANASKHKAMSYDRMEEKEKQLKAEVEKLLAQAAETDAAEDALYGKGKRGDELPAELARCESRLKKIAEAKAALEQEARDRAEAAKKAAEEKLEERRAGRRSGSEAKSLAGGDLRRPTRNRPGRIRRRNATSPIRQAGSCRMARTKGVSFRRTMRRSQWTGRRKSLWPPRSARRATTSGNWLPMLERVEQNMGAKPVAATADAGYFSEDQINDERVKDIELYIATGKQKHGQPEPADAIQPDELPTESDSAREKMKQKLKTEAGQALYKMRKAIVEPVFGQIKAARGIRAFLLRGIEKVSAEWKLICATHNLLKMFRAARQLQIA